MMPTHLDLCSGEHSWEQGGGDWTSLSLEKNPNQPATWNCDIRIAPVAEIKERLGGERPTLVTFSPPCTTFSIASCSTHWTTPPERRAKTEAAMEGLSIVNSGMMLTTILDPLFLVVENPRGLLRKMPVMHAWERMLGLKRVTVTYCSYGDTRMKPTDLWINARLASVWSPLPMCKNYQYDDNGDVINRHCHHDSARRGAKTGTQGLKLVDRSLIPPDLSRSIFDAMEAII